MMLPGWSRGPVPGKKIQKKVQAEPAQVMKNNRTESCDNTN
jgi:hypothetical protein